MKRVSSTEFTSDYGFSSPNFRVDSSGNITATSLNLSTVSDSNSTADFIFTDDENGTIFISPFENVNPTISFAKTRTYRLELELDTTELFFLKADQEDLITENITHSSGDTGASAQGKQTGIITFFIPVNYDENIIYYSDRDRNFFGEIEIVEQEGIFSTLQVVDNTNSTSKDTGSLTVAGGIGVEKTITSGENIVTPILTTTDIQSTNGLNIQVDGDILFLDNDSSVLGKINNNGSTIPLVNTTIQNSNIDNSAIGENNPSTAVFTVAQTQNEPTDNLDLTNKKYVDSTVTALAIALGI